MNRKKISKPNVDENVVRLVAAQTVILTITSLLTQWTFPVFLLTADFALRAFTNQPSPMAAVANIIAGLLKLKPRYIFAAPKKFAAGIGFLFSFAMLILFILRLYFAAEGFGSILVLCAILESVFNVCTGCYVYNWFVAPVVNKRNNKSRATTSDHH